MAEPIRSACFPKETRHKAFIVGVVVVQDFDRHPTA
jgi:hypothetical protein